MTDVDVLLATAAACSASWPSTLRPMASSLEAFAAAGEARRQAGQEVSRV